MTIITWLGYLQFIHITDAMFTGIAGVVPGAAGSELALFGRLADCLVELRMAGRQLAVYRDVARAIEGDNAILAAGMRAIADNLVALIGAPFNPTAPPTSGELAKYSAALRQMAGELADEPAA